MNSLLEGIQNKDSDRWYLYDEMLFSHVLWAYKYVVDTYEQNSDPALQEQIKQALDNPYLFSNSDTKIFQTIDSLISSINQFGSWGWMGNSSFINDMNELLENTKTRLTNNDTIEAKNLLNTFRSNIDQAYRDSSNQNNRFVTKEVWNYLFYNSSSTIRNISHKTILDSLISLSPSSIQAGSTIFILKIKGTGFNSQTKAFWNGDYISISVKSDTIIYANIPANFVLDPIEVIISVLNPVSTVSNDLTFNVISNSSESLTVKLTNSTNTLLPGGSLKYYEGSWKDAVNSGDGTFIVTTDRQTVSLRMTYEYSSQTVSNIPAQNNTYTFQTVNTNVELQNSQGTLIDEGSVKYYAGAWRDFGVTVNGVAVKELLPGNYSFRMTYEYGSNDKQQNIGTNSTVIFQTVNANVQLQNSQGNLITEEGNVKYYAGAWRDFGTTANGSVSKELLPNNYSFRMTYAYSSNDKQQNIGDNSTVIFQTVNANVQLKNSQGQLIDEGIVKYYAGAWRDFGTTINGVTTKELLPNNYSFRMIYEYISNDKQQDIGSNNIVNFSTVLCTVKVNNSQNQPVNNAEVKYYAGAWRELGTTVNGETTKELLPSNISFRASSGGVSQDKQQDIGTNSLVEINLP